MKGLTRVDHDGKRMYGWLVRAYGGGKTFSKYFSDKKYGGKEKAREIAVAYLEKMTAEVQAQFADFKPRQNMPGYRTVPGTSNDSGLVGIHRCETVSRGKSVKYWAATWKEDGRPKDKTFYFHDGFRTEEEARKMAIAWRAQKVRELEEASDKKSPKADEDFHKPRTRLISWVSGLTIEDWSPYLRRVNTDTTKTVKKREPFTPKRLKELVQFLGVTAAHFDWDEVDFEFGRGIFAGDIRSRCFWNKDGLRTDVLLDSQGRLLIHQGVEPDPYYLQEN